MTDTSYTSGRIKAHALAQAFVHTVRLPPNFKLSVLDSLGNDIGLLIVAEWEDIRPEWRLRGRPAQTASTVYLESHREISDEAWVNWMTARLYATIMELWMHELHEWFTIGGVHHVDPHPSGGGFQ